MLTHAEYTQVLRYNLLEHYSAHHDYFDVRDYGENMQVRRDTNDGNKNRLATVFFYLTNVTEGGATNFPRAGGLPTPHDYFDCSQGLSVYPKAGNAIIFYSLHPSLEMDPLSLHGGCDVIGGTKFAARQSQIITPVFKVIYQMVAISGFEMCLAIRTPKTRALSYGRKGRGLKGTEALLPGLIHTPKTSALS